MVRVVLDTNVLVSGLLFQGPPSQLLSQVLSGALQLAMSADLNAELERVLATKFPHAQAAIHDTMGALNDIAMFVTPTERVTVVHEDPDDNIVLECALAARADAIVSGDHHLLAVKTFRGIPIVSPHTFLTSSPA